MKNLLLALLASIAVLGYAAATHGRHIAEIFAVWASLTFSCGIVAGFMRLCLRKKPEDAMPPAYTFFKNMFVIGVLPLLAAFCALLIFGFFGSGP